MDTADHRVSIYMSLHSLDHFLNLQTMQEKYFQERVSSLLQCPREVLLPLQWGHDHNRLEVQILSITTSFYLIIAFLSLPLSLETNKKDLYFS